MKRIIAMTLILALTLAMFTGCSKTGSQPDGKPQPDSTGAASETEGKTAYQAAFLKLPDGLGYGAIVCLHGRRTLPRGDEPERSDHAGD